MKRKMIAAVAAILLLATTAWAEVDGFRGMKWGTDISEIKKTKSLVPANESGLDFGEETFKIKGDSMAIGGATMKSINYCFWHGKLKSVIAITDGYTNFINLKEATIAKFETAKESSLRRDSWFFTSAEEGEGRHAITGGMVEYNRRNDEGMLFLISMDLKGRQNEEREQRAKQAAKTDF